MVGKTRFFFERNTTVVHRGRRQSNLCTTRGRYRCGGTNEDRLNLWWFNIPPGAVLFSDVLVSFRTIGSLECFCIPVQTLPGSVGNITKQPL